jgi:hypothetical protein
MPWISHQLLSYPLAAWAVFLAITIIAAFAGRGWGIFAGHFAVAFAVMWFDVQWIQSEMAVPDWGGAPDQDFIFMIGVVIRVLLINAVLLPIAFLFRWLSLRRRPLVTQPVA